MASLPPPKPSMRSSFTIVRRDAAVVGSQEFSLVDLLLGGEGGVPSLLKAQHVKIVIVFQ